MTVPQLQPGQTYRTKASHFNAFARAANAYDARLLGGGVDLPRTQWQPDVRLIRNDSGEDCEAGDVLAIEGVVTTPEDLELDGADPDPGLESAAYFQRWGPELIFKGVQPDLSSPVLLNQHVGRFAVLLEPIPHDATNPKHGLAVFNGIVTCPIDMVYADHPFADLAHDTRRLTSNWYGSAEIIYTQRLVDGVVDDLWESGPEVVTWYATVRLGNFRSEELEVVVSEASGIAYGASGTASVKWGGVLADPLQTLTIYFNRLGTGNTLTNGRAADVRYDRSMQQWRVMGANCL